MFPYLFSVMLKTNFNGLAKEQQLLEFQQFQECVLIIIWRNDENSFILSNIVNDGLVMGWGSVDKNNGEDHQQCLEDKNKERHSHEFLCPLMMCGL